MSSYQLKIADLYNTPNDNVKKLVPNFSDKVKYKLLNNAVYGKSIENLGNRTDVKLENAQHYNNCELP